ncbi:MAG: histidine ammonia-lyase, partial [Alphaproteobacteria bacterium]|nr:histidine ammonia-lyase [Alphaproteobacteria bacterium]
MRIDGGRLSLAALRRVAAGAETVELDPRAEAAMTASVEAVRAIVAQGNPAYGINTGFGKLAKTQIPASDLATLQRNLVLSHCVGLGPPLDERTTRLVLALKAASLACGLSGVRPRIVAALIKFLTEDLLPVIPAKGSVGASGDLAPLAHMTAALMGIGSVRHKGRTLRATDALRRAGLDPLVLEAKEGLALINGTQVSTALALSGLFAIEDCFAAALGAGALSVDAARGSDAPFDPRIHAARGHAGQGEVAARLRGLLAGSGIRASHLVNDERVQDPYSLRCQPQVMGACLDLLHQAAATIATEAASVTDNPLVFAETGEVLSGGNFHAEPVAFASD